MLQSHFKEPWTCQVHSKCAINGRWHRLWELGGSHVLCSQPHQHQSPSRTVVGNPYPREASKRSTGYSDEPFSKAKPPSAPSHSPHQRGLCLLPYTCSQGWVSLTPSPLLLFLLKLSNSLSKWISFSFLPQIPKMIPNLTLDLRPKAKVKP